MAKQDKATYDSYAPDAFDNPPAGPVGVHRGPRSAGARIAPYIIVLIAAILAGALTWSLVTGEFSKITGLGGGSNTAQTGNTTTSTSGSGSSDTTGSSSDGTSDGSTDSSGTSNGSTDTNDSGSSDATTDNNTQSEGQTDQTQSDTQTDQSAQVNKSTSVRVVNAAGIRGYAGQKKTALESAGYTAVEAANPTTSNLPSSTVVWYQNDSDKATAEDVASTLGITNVEQTTGLSTPIVVVLLN